MSDKSKHGRRRHSAAETGGIHSNAFNFMSAVNTGVDPRTGMYSCSISLPGVAANNLCGPTVGLGLTFSPLNPVNIGFGVGWALTTTRYDSVRKRLSLSSGESFLVDTFVDDKATFKDRKLRSFDMIRMSLDGAYRIVHKAGHSEFLKELPGSEGMAVLQEVQSPEGYAVTLEQTASNGIARLRRVIDGTGRVLLRVTYEIGRTLVTLHPETVQAVTFTFRLTNDLLVELALPEGYGGGWLFGYEMRRGRSRQDGRSFWQKALAWLRSDNRPRVEPDMLLLNRVTVPTGGVEEATYKHDGHALPGDDQRRPMSHMPYVTAFSRKPGHRQPPMKTMYAYSDSNYFGHGALTDWMDDEDNLYRVVMPPGQRYEYSSTETQYDGISPVRTIERTFNRFHLMTLERSTQDGCVTEVETAYDEDPGTSFAYQVPWCQLPVRVRTRYFRNVEPGRHREQVRTSVYDAHGNVLKATDERGVAEVYGYYPIEGISGKCPPDTLGFVRFLREKRVYPPAGSEGPVRSTRYTYKELASRIDGDPYHVVPWTEVLYQIDGDDVDIPLGETSQHFIGGGGPDHGRLGRVSSHHNSVENSVDYTYTYPTMEKDASDIDVPVLTITTSKISSNGEASQYTTAAAAVSCLSGLSVMDRSPNGVVMRYSHDALGRHVAETVAADSDFAATTTSAYLVRPSGSRIVNRSVTGQETVVELDGFGTAIRVLACNWNDDGLEHEIWRAAFDATGRKVSETVTDIGLSVASAPPPYAADANVPTTDRAVATTTTYAYDGWGSVTEVRGADGVIDHHVLDPIDGVGERWQEADGSEGRVRCCGARVEQTTSGKPARVDTLNADGSVCLSQYSIYDGLDRLTQTVVTMTGEGDRVTRYGYDVYDRLVETIRPDGAVITTEYAGYTEGALVTAIRIQHASLGSAPILLGRQAYDGLGRRSLLQAGRRETTYHYDAATSAKPDRMTLPSGEGVTYRHEAHLGDRLIEAVSNDGVTTFTYDSTTGDSLSVSNAFGEHRTEYDPSGRVSGEASHHEGVAGEVRCSYRYSLRGELTEYTDVSGDRHKIIYDGLGRFVRMECNDVSVDVTYDAFSRPRRTLTQSRDGSLSMDVQVSFDEHDREIGRVLTARSGSTVSVQSLVQTYTADAKLATRRLNRDDSEREETFTYDVRDRLAAYTCTGEHAPKDDSGHFVTGQVLEYDALDNVVKLVTTYRDEFPAETRRFVYADDDATQLQEIIIEQGGRKVDGLSFTYDAAGNLLHDEKGRRLLYDALGRPAGWSHEGAYREYRYDAFGRVGSTHDGKDERHRYYLGGRISRDEGKDTAAAFHYVQGAVVAQTRTGSTSDEVILPGGDSQGSVIAEAGFALTALAYTPHGYRDAAEGTSDIGFTGELKEREVDWYVLGHYRAYNPTLQRFHSPDANSPFGHGGLNAYAYCSGDPVNHSDPSGEGWLDWLFVGIGVVASGIAIVASGGTLAPAIGAVVSLTATASQTAAVGLVVADVTSIGLAIGSAVASDAGDDALAGKLGLASMVMGLGGLGATVGPTLASQAIKGGKRFLAATKYVRPPAVRSPLALKAPSRALSKLEHRLRAGCDNTGANSYASPAPPRALPSDAALRAMNGFERLNTATHDVLMRRHMIVRGLISQPLLARFPQGIDLASRDSVIHARYVLSMALIDADGLNAGMLVRTGFDVDALANLNPSRVPGQTPTLPADELRAFIKRPYGHVIEEGEHLYAKFLETGDLGYFVRYGRALLRARTTNRWSRWNSSSTFVL